MQERRKTNRKFLLYFIRVFDAGSRQQIGNLVDITPKGIMIVSSSAIPTNKEMQLRLELTPDVSDSTFMEISTLSKWCRPDVDPSLFDIGFKILKLTPEATGIIQRIVDTFGFRENRAKV